MIGKIKALFVKYYDILVYLVFGVLTTVVNYLIFLPCYNLLGLSSSVSNVMAWVVAVAFAYVTNKPFVFRSHDWSRETVIPELSRFIGTRLGSGALETLILLVTVDWLGMNGNLWKIVTSVLVVIINYVGSKLLVFRKK
ncbi:MAG: GtrA family protein [Ruminococcaceae bacterium]|nr:GtrA family protein [Oscillospiraceae bacterium]